MPLHLKSCRHPDCQKGCLQLCKKVVDYATQSSFKKDVRVRFTFGIRIYPSVVNGAICARHILIQVQRYVEDEWSVLPKAGAITLGNILSNCHKTFLYIRNFLNFYSGGMAGFVLGMKRGGFGRAMGSATGLMTMAAFCYPHETVVFLNR